MLDKSIYVEVIIEFPLQVLVFDVVSSPVESVKSSHSSQRSVVEAETKFSLVCGQGNIFDDEAIEWFICGFAPHHLTFIAMTKFLTNLFHCNKDK
jgi:hypothetical protein